MRHSSILSTVLLTIACASSAPAPKARDARAEGELKEAMKRRDALKEELAATTPEHRQRCEFQAGDCRMEVTDRRLSLLESHPSERCRPNGDPEAQIDCVLNEVAAGGDAKTPVGYYAFESQCLEQLIACTGKVVAQTATQQRTAEANRRRERIETSREGIELATLVPYASEKTAYLRSALPPSDDEVCRAHERFAKCEAEAKSLSGVFDRELDKPDSEYRDAAALKLFSAARKAEAKCYKPDLDCLTRQMGRYGGNSETNRFLSQSLDALERRERLVIEAGPAAESCINSGVQKHQAQIVDSYQRFVRDPGTYFQAQLHRSFRSLYEAQVRCLESIPRRRVAPLAELVAADGARSKDAAPVRIAGAHEGER
jgi:hypothetical protein